WIGGVPAAHPNDGCFELVEAALLDSAAELGAESGRQRCFVDHEAASGLCDGGDDRVDVEREQGAQVDDLGIDAGLGGGGFGNVDERAVREHGQIAALAVHAGDA